MPILNLPLDVPGAEITEMMKEIVDELTAEFETVAQSVYSDGIFPGTNPMTDRQKLLNFLEVTDPHDYQNLFDDNYLLRLQNGLDAPPVSPFWLNQLSVRSSFDRNRAEFVRLITQAKGREDRFTIPKNY